MDVATGHEKPPSVLAAESVLGAGLPAAAQEHLTLAGSLYEHDALALDHLRQAEAIAPSHPAVLIGLYRFYFYKGRLLECLEVAHVCLSEAAHHNGLVDDWREVQSGDADFGSYDALMPRFYMFVLKGYAYLQMRLGNLDEGLAATMKLLELDSTDKVGATVLLEVHKRMELGDEE